MLESEKLKNFSSGIDSIDKVFNIDSEKLIDNRKIGKKSFVAVNDTPEDVKEYNTFKYSQMLERMDKYLDSITDEDLPNIIRGVRKHVEKFRQKIKANHVLYERAEEKSEFINAYFYCICLKDFLRSRLNSYDIDIIISSDTPANEEAAHIAGDDQTITMFLNPKQNLNIGEMTENLAHEMWHYKQLEMAYCPEEDIKVEDIAAYQNALENYLSSDEFGIEENINQPIEIEAYLFGKEFMKRFASNDGYIMEKVLREEIGNRDNLGDIIAEKDYEMGAFDYDDDLLRYLSEEDGDGYRDDDWDF